MKHTLSMMCGLISLFAMFLGGFKSVTLQTTDDHILMFEWVRKFIRKNKTSGKEIR